MTVRVSVASIVLALFPLALPFFFYTFQDEIPPFDHGQGYVIAPAASISAWRLFPASIGRCFFPIIRISQAQNSITFV
jgi:hypothetical protein